MRSADANRIAGVSGREDTVMAGLGDNQETAARWSSEELAEAARFAQRVADLPEVQRKAWITYFLMLRDAEEFRRTHIIELE